MKLRMAEFDDVAEPSLVVFTEHPRLPKRCEIAQGTVRIECLLSGSCSKAARCEVIVGGVDEVAEIREDHIDLGCADAGVRGVGALAPAIGDVRHRDQRASFEGILLGQPDMIVRVHAVAVAEMVLGGSADARLAVDAVGPLAFRAHIESRDAYRVYIPGHQSSEAQKEGPDGIAPFAELIGTHRHCVFRTRVGKSSRIRIEVQEIDVFSLANRIPEPRCRHVALDLRAGGIDGGGFACRICKGHGAGMAPHIRSRSEHGRVPPCIGCIDHDAENDGEGDEEKERENRSAAVLVFSVKCEILFHQLGSIAWTTRVVMFSPRAKSRVPKTVIADAGALIATTTSEPVAATSTTGTVAPKAALRVA